jgi:lysine-N-methylase
MTTLPYRPRLAEQGLLRRHLVDGELKLLLHDTRVGEALELTPDQLEQLLACDGTRDLGGVLLAAARRGAYRRASDIETLITELAARGLMADGTAPPHPVLDHPDDARPEPAERPIEVLEGYGLHCDGNGSCCTTYASVPFTRAERRRALAAMPEVAERLGERVFLPLYGSTEGNHSSVAMVNGACAMLGEDGHCGVHARAGAAAKPRGCWSYPAQYVDDGEAVRVSVAAECRCVMASAGREGGEPLVPAAVERAGQLVPGTRIAALPEEVVVSGARRAPRARLRAFTKRALALPTSDGIASLWGFADAVERDGLDAALEPDPSPPPAAAMGYLLLSLAARTADNRLTVAGWRSERDRARRLAEWLDDAAQLLLEPAIQRDRLAGPDMLVEQERFFVRACLHGYQLGIGQRSVVQGLRDRAIRLLLARQLANTDPGVAADDPSVAYPITAVEVAMRGQGLASYASVG